MSTKCTKLRKAGRLAGKKHLLVRLAFSCSGAKGDMQWQEGIIMNHLNNLSPHDVKR